MEALQSDSELSFEKVLDQIKADDRLPCPNTVRPPKGSCVDWDELLTRVPVEFWSDEMRRAETYEEAARIGQEQGLDR